MNYSMIKDRIKNHWVTATKDGKIPYIMIRITHEATIKCNLVKVGKQEFMDTDIEVNVYEITPTYSQFEIDGIDADNIYQKYIKIAERLRKLKLGLIPYCTSKSK